MAFKLNIFTGTLDIVDSAGATTWLPPVDTRGDLPSGDIDGAVRIVLDEEIAFQYDNASDTWYVLRDNISAYSGTSDADAVTVEPITTVGTPNIVDYQITAHAADATNPGVVSTTTQTFAGDKTFNDDVIVEGDFTVNGTTTTINTATLDVEDANITINKNGTQATADSNDAGLTIEMSDATDVVFGYDSTLESRMKLGDSGDEREVMTVSHTQTVTNKDMGDSSNILTTASSDSFTRESGNQQVITIPDSTTPDNFVLEDFAQTLSNKTIDNSNTVTLEDTSFTLQDDGDNSKQAQFELSGITTATTRTFTFPDADAILVGTDTTQNISNKSLDNTNDITILDNNFTIQDDGDNSKQAVFEASSITTATTRTYTLPDGDTTLVGTALTQTLSNKSLDNTNDATLQDDSFTLQDNGDNSKQAQFELSNITTATTRTYSLPDADTTLVGTDTTQTISNKTIDNTNSITVEDANFTLQDDGDNSKQAQFELSAISTATTRTYLFPDISSEIITDTATQTLQNKTIDATAATGNNTITMDADDVTYDNGTSGLAATNVQDAIDENAAEKVSGPASATDEAIARYDGTTGKLIQNSSITIDDADIMSGATQLNVDNLRLDGNTLSSTDTNGNVILTPDGTGEVQSSSNFVIQDENELRLEDSAGTNYIGFKAPSTVTSSTTFELPDGDGNPDEAILTNGAGVLSFQAVVKASSGDLNEASASLLDNQATPIDVTGLAFANATVRSADIQYSIVIDATADLYEEGSIRIVQRGADWTIAREFSGDDSLVDFTITNAGQIQYTTPTYAGFSSANINFRAFTTSV